MKKAKIELQLIEK